MCSPSGRPFAHAVLYGICYIHVCKQSSRWKDVGSPCIIVTMHGTEYIKKYNLFRKLDVQFETQTVTTNVKIYIQTKTAVNRLQWYVLPDSCPGQYHVKNLLYFHLLRQNPRILQKYKANNLPAIFYERKHCLPTERK
jgi:hypothetical protein